MEHTDNDNTSGHVKADDATQLELLDQYGFGGAIPHFTAEQEREITREADENVLKFLQSQAANLAAGNPTADYATIAAAKSIIDSGPAASHALQPTQAEGKAQAEKRVLSDAQEQDVESVVQGVIDKAVHYVEGIQYSAYLDKMYDDAVKGDTYSSNKNKARADERPATVSSNVAVASSSLPTSTVYGRMGAELDTSFDDFFAGNPGEEDVEPDDEAEFTQRIAAHLTNMKPAGDHRNQRITQGTMAAARGVHGSLGHESQTISSGETHPQMAQSKMLPSAFHNANALRYEKPGNVARDDRKGQDGFQLSYRGPNPAATKAGYMPSGTNSLAQPWTKSMRVSSAPAAPGTGNDPFGVQPSTPGFVQDTHHNDDELTFSPAHNHHVPDQSLKAHPVPDTPFGNTAPRAETHTKRKAAEVFIEDDEDDDDYDDEDGSEGDGSSYHGSDRVGEDVSVKSDSYEPSESGDDETDTEEDVPSMDSRPYPDGSKKEEGPSIVVSKPTYHYVDDGGNDEDSDATIDVERKDDRGVDEGRKEAKTSSHSQAVILAPSDERSVNPFGEKTNEAFAEGNTEPTGPLTPQGSASILLPEATPDSEPLVRLSWKLPRYQVEVIPLQDNEDAPEVFVNLPNMPRETLILTPDHAHQEVHLLKHLFIPGQQALAEPEEFPRQALLNFHTISTMVLEAYTSYELGDLHTKGSIAPAKDEDKETAALDATKDEIFFAVLDRWRVGLSEEALKPSYKLIRGAQEFCDIALDVIHYLEDNGFVDGPQMMSKERKERKDKGVKKGKTKVEKEEEGTVVVMKGTDVKGEETPKKRGRPKKADGDSPGSAKGKADKVHRPPVKKKAKTTPGKTTPGKKAKKEPTISVVKAKGSK